jgi:hypothetical protein
MSNSSPFFVCLIKTDGLVFFYTEQQTFPLCDWMKLHDETRSDCEIPICALSRLCITVFLPIKRKKWGKKKKNEEEEEKKEEKEAARILSQVSIE